MLHITPRSLGAFVTHATLVADWKRYYAREDNHNGAKNLLSNLQQGLIQELNPATAHRMLTTFVAHHNTSGVSNLIKYMRETMQVELQPFHYNCLLRVSAFTRDKKSIVQLLEVMASRESCDGESFGCAINALHALNAEEVFPKVMQIVSIIEENGIDLAETVPAASTSSSAPLGAPPALKASPVLTALMHHICMLSYGPLCAMLVAFWICGVGAEMSSWDYGNLLACLLRDAAQFPSVRQVFSYVDGVDTGHITFENVASRVSAQCQRDEVSVLLAAIKRSFERHGVTPTTPIRMGFVNCRFAVMEQLVHHIFDDIHRGDGVGAHRENPYQVHHMLLLLHAQLRNSTHAALSLVELSKRYSSWLKRPQEPQRNTSDATTSDGKARFEIECYALWDVGVLLPSVCAATRESVTQAFTSLMAVVQDTHTLLQKSYCGSYAIPLITSFDEAKVAFEQIVSTMKNVSRPSRLQRQLFKSFAALCIVNPPRNPKLTAKGVEERAKWFMYLEARDIAITLHGSSNVSPEKIHQLFASNNSLPTLRSEETVKEDCAALRQLFKIEPTPARLTPSLLRLPRETVPAHMVDPAVHNPYPAVKMLLPLNASLITEDLFALLWEYLTTCGEDWYLKDQELVMLLLRCLLHRLDWENAVSLASSALKYIAFSYEMDSELSVIFDEIGDPAGALCFKMASKILDWQRAAAEAKKSAAADSANSA